MNIAVSPAADQLRRKDKLTKKYLSRKGQSSLMAFSEGLTSQDLYLKVFNRMIISVALFSLSIFFSVMADKLSVTDCSVTIIIIIIITAFI